LTRRIPFCEIRAALINNNSSGAAVVAFPVQGGRVGPMCRDVLRAEIAVAEGLRRRLVRDILPAPLEGWHRASRQ
jgi:hypothetical protein